MRWPLFFRVADLRRFSKLLKFLLESSHLILIAFQLQMHTHKRLMHLFQIMLQVRDHRFEVDNAVPQL